MKFEFNEEKNRPSPRTVLILVRWKENRAVHRFSTELCHYNGGISPETVNSIVFDQTLCTPLSSVTRFSSQKFLCWVTLDIFKLPRKKKTLKNNFGLKRINVVSEFNQKYRDQSLRHLLLSYHRSYFIWSLDTSFNIIHDLLVSSFPESPEL